MKWNKFTLKTRSEVEDIVISTLADVGIEGVEIQDKQPLTESDKQQMFVDIMPDIPDDDGIAYLNFYLDVDEDKEKVLADVRAALAEMQEFLDLGECTITESETEDKDWINNWKQYFKQFYVDDILIIPSWEEVKPEDRDKMIIHIDPGTAFGTGMHETTQLCIRQLKKYVTKDTELLDVGTGSGILSIIALKLGARHAVGTDLDPCAVPAVEENKEVNGIPVEAFDMMIGNIIDDKEVQDRVGYEKYDIVTANILADVLVPLTPVIVHQMKPGAVYITSGILDVKEEVVKEAVVAAGLEVVEVTHQGDWVSVPARQPMSIKKRATPEENENRFMYRFIVEDSQLYDGTVHITGSDVNHIKNVLRMRPGEKILVSTGGEKEYHCAVSDFPEGEVLAAVEEVTAADRELPSGIVLFQGLPKGDKMELIIQKAVELGATEIVPVEMKRCVVKLDRKKAEKKAERWQTIALGAAKQSKRMQIPTVHMPVTFQQALAMMAESDVRLMPYENAEGMEGTRKILESIEPGESIAILIGPEGGIDEAEVEMAMKEKVEPITLGKRILRTETAGMTVLSILVYLLEGRERTR